MFARALLAHSAARKIQGMILSGELGVGRGSRRSGSSPTLGISRASLREALLTLETLGLVKTEPGRGTFVSPRTANPAWRAGAMPTAIRSPTCSRRG